MRNPRLTGATRDSRSCAAMLTALLALALPAAASDLSSPDAGSGDLNTIVDLVTAGQFQAAEARIDADLKQPGLSAETRRAFEFQRERMTRIRDDFSLDADQVKSKLREQIPDLADADFVRWDRQDLFEHMLIDGERRYFQRSPSNLFRLSTEARARSKGLSPFADNGLPKDINDRYAEDDGKTLRQALATNRSSVLPQRVKVTQSLTVNADAVPAGKTIRAWIPYPRAIPGQQEQIRFIASQPSTRRIAPESALQRTIHLERTAQAGKPTVLSVTYEVTLFAQYHAIDADRVVLANITPELAPFTAERAPHIVFTEPLRVFSRQVVGDTVNPYRIAQKIFAAVDEIPWAGALEYSTIANLSSYTLQAGHGDCGEQTMLLIGLMRMNGIPARWQSGWTFTDGDYNNIHDWAEIYLAPYGWIPVDVTYGRLDVADPPLKWFYLGGLDNFRIAFNDDFSQDFVPPKQFFRSDTVDSQRGEVEWEGGNLYYDQWNYDFSWKILAPRRD
ncbi:MAG: transglutaminase domain-containing protein [Rudaea sp.]|uniref:transglutaminase-like domain-containing protein n=1 Tax=unclassified Rudaea TaxID=2627037 RepID=UPI0010F600FE|nr:MULTISPECIES: transglutaminase-like domain-containing protein [unclassified Rudaea]MBN8885077.1 transglutaminase domain-containing protein [Rudaea sp.]MBR0344294.1 transglutaminase domain-containing protein [Rudaea sp.]